MALALGKNEIYRNAIETAEKITGIDGSALAALIDAEAAKIPTGPDKGQWDRTSYNARSGAAGMAQFLASTWIGHARNPTHLLNARGKEAAFITNDNRVAEGKKDDLLDLRFDPLLSIVSTAEYSVDNLKALERAGVLPANLTEDQRARYMYLAHHEGAGGAVGFLTGTKTYTRANLIRQVGAAAADRHIAASGGDTSTAYRRWLSEYMDNKIVPSRFRDGAAAALALKVAPAGVLEGLAYVTTEGLNFRKEPRGEIIRSLTIGEPVEIVARIGNSFWYDVEIDGTRGCVSGAYLRSAIAPSKERLLEKLIAEWVRFKKGHSSEEDEPYNTYVHEMWLVLGKNYYGNSRYPNGTDVPWSAAFISFVVANSGPEYAEFFYSASHSEFSNDAIRARVMEETDEPFWGYRITEVKPEIGDIVHRNRSGGTYTYEYAENHSDFASHSDIVCEVRGNVARVIGGNTGRGEGTVAMSEYALDNEGYLAGGQRIIAVLKNRSHEVPLTA